MPERPQPKREVLPIPDITHVGLTTYDAKDPATTCSRRSSRCGRRKALRTSSIVLIDDVGFGASSAFGGPINTPNSSASPRTGLKYNRFHTTALCSPTRQALLTGRNHHTVGMGGITEIATSAPGYNSIRPNDVRATGRDAEAERLLDRSVREVPRGAGLGDEPDGPVQRLADGGGGFEYFYGFIGGETNQYCPAIYEGTVPVEPERHPKRGTTSWKT